VEIDVQVEAARNLAIVRWVRRRMGVVGAAIGVVGAELVAVTLDLLFPSRDHGGFGLGTLVVLVIVGLPTGSVLGAFAASRSRSAVVSASIAATLASGPLTGFVIGASAAVNARPVGEMLNAFMSLSLMGAFGSLVLSPVLVPFGVMTGYVLDFARRRLTNRAERHLTRRADARSIAAEFE